MNSRFHKFPSGDFIIQITSNKNIQTLKDIFSKYHYKEIVKITYLTNEILVNDFTWCISSVNSKNFDFIKITDFEFLNDFFNDKLFIRIHKIKNLKQKKIKISNILSNINFKYFIKFFTLVHSKRVYIILTDNEYKNKIMTYLKYFNMDISIIHNNYFAIDFKQKKILIEVNPVHYYLELQDCEFLMLNRTFFKIVDFKIKIKNIFRLNNIKLYGR